MLLLIFVILHYIVCRFLFYVTEKILKIDKMLEKAAGMVYNIPAECCWREAVSRDNPLGGCAQSLILRTAGQKISAEGEIAVRLEEKTIATKEIFSGYVFDVKVDTVSLPDGSTAPRELVIHNGGVGVLALDDEGRALMVRQYRKGAEREMLEIPAGKLEKGEDPAECGRRELEEETGYLADSLEFLGEIFPTPGYCSEKITLYYAAGLHKTAQRLDEGEFLRVCSYTLEELRQKIMSNELTDAKTIVAVLKLSEKLKNG